MGAQQALYETNIPNIQRHSDSVANLFIHPARLHHPPRPNQEPKPVNNDFPTSLNAETDATQFSNWWETNVLAEDADTHALANQALETLKGLYGGQQSVDAKYGQSLNVLMHRLSVVPASDTRSMFAGAVMNALDTHRESVGGEHCTKTLKRIGDLQDHLVQLADEKMLTSENHALGIIEVAEHLPSLINCEDFESVFLAIKACATFEHEEATEIEESFTRTTAVEIITGKKISTCALLRLL